ncbi:helix-turn-helix transcriptional regulator [Streptomyces sp. MNU76]|uniref:helix-turn-helix transcriptional regulator n=1 Tax=Streptomyces sp. MNU76 TaxID=2560026 RepID=UPI0035A86306
MRWSNSKLLQHGVGANGHHRHRHDPGGRSGFSGDTRTQDLGPLGRRGSDCYSPARPLSKRGAGLLRLLIGHMMGRPEKPVVACSTPVRTLALWLRTQRGRAGLSYAQLAAKCGCSASKLSRAASGAVVPALSTTEAWAKACGADPGRAKSLWRKARAAAWKGSASRLQLDLVRDFNDLRTAMQALRTQAGVLSLRDLERLAGPGKLPRSTLHTILSGESRPSLGHLCAFVAACGIAPAHRHEWVHAWNRANAHRWSRRGGGYMIAPTLAASPGSPPPGHV